MLIKKQGFTLVELLLVVSLISILSGVGLFTFNKALARQKVSSQADRVVDFIQKAQNYARSGLTISGVGTVDAFYFQASSGGTSFSVNYQKGASSGVVESASLESPVAFSGSSCGGACQISFSTPLGKLTGGIQSVAVCLTGTGYYQITVEPSGQVSKSLLQTGSCP